LFADLEERGLDSVRVLVARRGDGGLRGMLMLVREDSAPRALWTLAGTDQDTRGVLTIDSPETAEVLASALVADVHTSGAPVELMLGPVSADDPCAHALASALPGGHVVPDAPIPVLEKREPSIDVYLSKGMRKTLRKAHNRLEKDGHVTNLSLTRDVGEISDWLPVLADAHRERDHVHGRESDLDNDLGRRVWERRLMALALRGRLELAVLRIDGEFAAHTLGAYDTKVFRLLEGRFVTRWARYAPGRLLEAMVLDRVLNMPGNWTVDWMSSVAPESLIAANGSHPMMRVHWSSSF